MLEVWERPGSKAKQELTDHEDWLVRWDHLDLVAPMERREKLGLQDHQADEDPEESLAQQEKLVPLAPLDSQDPLDLMVSLE